MWNASIGFIAGLMDESGADRIWRGTDTEPIFANSGSPGVAAPVDGGYWISGTWKIVSGVNHTNWLAVFAVIMAGTEPATTESGAPNVRPFMIPRGQFTVRNTWHVNGMRGSGSNDVVVDDVFEPADLTMRIDIPAESTGRCIGVSFRRWCCPAAPPSSSGWHGRPSPRRSGSRRRRKRPAGVLADDPYTQSVIARSQAELDAARLLLFDALGRIETAVEGRAPVTLAHRAARVKFSSSATARK